MKTSIKSKSASRHDDSAIGRVWRLEFWSWWISLAAIMVLNTNALLAAEPFFAPPESSGSVIVKLYPTEGVTGTSLVTFGVPFTRGSVRPADLDKVRVLKGGVEIPAYVEMLAPWRHLTDPAQDGAYVRVARIQITVNLTNAYPSYDSVTVEWGMTTRTLNVTTLQDPRSAWHVVVKDLFVTSDNVQEPDVYPVLPKEHMCKGMLTGFRMKPLDGGVPEGREDPAATAAITNWSGNTQMEHAFHNFFFTTINEDDPRVTATYMYDYTQSEPWLYDRVSVMFYQYFRSGWLKPFRAAVANADYYKNNLLAPSHPNPHARGLLGLLFSPSLGASDWVGATHAMYSYNEPLAYMHWLLGDNAVLDQIHWVSQAHQDLSDAFPRWNPNDGWTERHIALRIRAEEIEYEVFGSTQAPQAKQDVLDGIDGLIWHQNGAGGALPPVNAETDGGLWHLVEQHEGDGPPLGLKYMFSPWMSALICESMVRAYSLTERTDVAQFLRRLANCEKFGCKWTDSNELECDFDNEMMVRVPEYITLLDGTSYTEPVQPQHCLDAATILAWGYYFSDLFGAKDETLKQTAEQVYFVYGKDVIYWTRPNNPANAGAPAYRINPWRMYNWQYHPVQSFTWILEASSASALTLSISGPKTNASFVLQLNGVPGQTCRIQYVDNLASTNWQTLGGGTNDTSGKFELSDTPPSGALQRYYRAVCP